jgi:hypothetical protein
LVLAALILESGEIRGKIRLAGRIRNVEERYFGGFRNALAAPRVILALPRIIQKPWPWLCLYCGLLRVIEA